MVYFYRMEEIDLKRTKDLSCEHAKKIGEVIKKCREDKKISQSDLSFFSYTDRKIINKIEKGVYVNITIYTLWKIATALGEHINIFF